MVMSGTALPTVPGRGAAGGVLLMIPLVSVQP
jgi:hypothetical protein